MMFVDQTYINTALKSEAAYHERKVEQLQRTIKRLTEALTLENLQHRSRIMELEKVQSHIAPLATQPEPKQTKQPTLQPLPGSKQKWSQVRKHHRHTTNPALIHKAS